MLYCDFPHEQLINFPCLKNLFVLIAGCREKFTLSLIIIQFTHYTHTASASIETEKLERIVLSLLFLAVVVRAWHFRFFTQNALFVRVINMFHAKSVTQFKVTESNRSINKIILSLAVYCCLCHRHSMSDLVFQRKKNCDGLFHLPLMHLFFTLKEKNGFSYAAL